jgi:hypothetical protein
MSEMEVVTSYYPQWQDLPELCWAAVASCVSLCYDPDSQWDQGSIVAQKLKNISCKRIKIDRSTWSICNQPIDSNSIVDILTNITQNCSSSAISGPPSFEAIIQQLGGQYKYPIVCEITWTNPNTLQKKGHIISIIGYHPTTKEIIIADPDYSITEDGSGLPAVSNGIFTYPYTSFVNGEYRNGGVCTLSVATTPNIN